MKKIAWLKIIPVAFCLFIVLSPSVQAANLYDAFRPSILSTAAGKNYNTQPDVFQIVSIVIQSLLTLLGVLFMLLVIYGGITWIMAEGDEAKVEKAQKIMRSAIIGIIIVLAAFAISFFVTNVLIANTLKTS